MNGDRSLVDLADATALGAAVAGSKATVLAELAAAGFAVPPGFVVTAAALDDPRLGERLTAAARRLGADRFAVRSSGVAEDLPGASYAGLYETVLNAAGGELGEAVRRCFAAAGAERVVAYRSERGGPGAAMAVLVQVMVDAAVAGVAFTANPVTGDRDQTIVTAVRGLGEPLVSGEATGEEWTTTGEAARLTRPAPHGTPVLTAAQAVALAALARQVADRYGQPQDVEWAVDQRGQLWLLQARPMTALPEPVSWTAPGPGLWMRNFRLGEWLPEAVTPLFGTWLLPALEDGYLDGMHGSIGVRVPFRYTLVNGWYYNATPIPSPTLLARVLWQGRARLVRTLYHALARVSRDPAAADHAVLGTLRRQWRDEQLPRYQRLVTAAQTEAGRADPRRSATMVDELGREAGIALWYLAIVGGSAWKMESCLLRFARTHLADALPDADGGIQALLRGLPGTQYTPAPHAVYSIDWHHPLAAELPAATPASAADRERHTALAAVREAAEERCVAALASRPALVARFHRLLRVTQHYAEIREAQARDLTLAWPTLRACVHRLGRHLTTTGLIDRPDDVYFCTRDELHAALTDPAGPLTTAVAERRTAWHRQRRLAAPLTLGRPPRLIGDVIARAVTAARGPVTTGEGVIIGHPASAGRATGPVRIIDGPQDFAAFTAGDVLVAKATAPAWTPLFGRAAAVVTDGGTLAAHASLIAREYGIPAVVGTGNATHLLRPGQRVTVDGTTGTVTPHPDQPATPA